LLDRLDLLLGALQATNDRLLRTASTGERSAKATEGIEAQLLTTLHILRSDIAAIKAAFHVRDEIREATGSFKVQQPHTAITMMGMFATMRPWLQVLLVFAFVVVLLAVGGKLGVAIFK